jgi:hypothetical protein
MNPFRSKKLIEPVTTESSIEGRQPWATLAFCSMSGSCGVGDGVGDGIAVRPGSREAGRRERMRLKVDLPGVVRLSATGRLNAIATIRISLPRNAPAEAGTTNLRLFFIALSLFGKPGRYCFRYCCPSPRDHRKLTVCATHPRLKAGLRTRPSLCRPNCKVTRVRNVQDSSAGAEDQAPRIAEFGLSRAHAIHVTLSAIPRVGQ